MYKCSKCGLGVLVTGLERPVRFCNCSVNVKRGPKGLIEKLRSFFGKEYFYSKPASIIVDLEGTVDCKSKTSL